MASAIEMTGTTARMMVTGEKVRPQYEYVDGVRTEHPRTDEQNRPLHRVGAVVEMDGSSLGHVSVLTPDPAPFEQSPMGTVLEGTFPHATVSIQDQYTLRTQGQVYDVER